MYYNPAGVVNLFGGFFACAILSITKIADANLYRKKYLLWPRQGRPSRATTCAAFSVVSAAQANNLKTNINHN
jgi:hypothetical protein